MVVGLEATHPTIPLKGKTFDEAFARLDRQTLGQLIKNGASRAEIDESILCDLSGLLVKRNYLVHHFFRENSEKLLTQSGRRVIIDELQSLIGDFHKGDQLVTQVYSWIWEKLGVDCSTIDRQNVDDHPETAHRSFADVA